jgi:uncharacterized membrane protein YecN with MAPEG domain
MAIAAFYASLLAAVFALLTMRTVNQRRQSRVELGTGENAELLRRSRVHANFAEYAPFVLLLIALAESLKAPSLLLHIAGLALLAGRLFHAYGLSQTPQILRYRLWGMVLTLTAMALAALMCFGLAVLNMAV